MLNLQGLLNLLNSTDIDSVPDEIKKWREVYFRMSLHIDGAAPAFTKFSNGIEGTITPYNYFGPEYQKIFNDYLYNKYPTEPEIVRQWRLSQHKPFTKKPFQQAIQVVTGAIFQDSNYSITVADKDDNDYIWGNNFEGQNLPSYFAASFQEICNDPNGLFVVIPSQPWYATITPRINPVVRFVRSKHIVRVTPHEVIFDMGGYRWAVNAIGYFRFVKNEKTGKWEEQDGGRGYYGHMLGYIPAFVAGGQWNTQGFYESHFEAARAIADESIGAKSSEQFVMKDASHPIRIEAQVDCPDCDHGKIAICTKCNHEAAKCDCSDYTPGLLRCNTCHGTGNMPRNPGDVMLADPADLTGGGQLVQYVNPDTAINKLHIENNKEISAEIMSALHLHVIDEAQSGVAKDKDMETRYQFILFISNDLFDRLLPKSIETILSLRNVRSNNGITAPATTDYVIVKPTQFDIKTAQDLLNEYETASNAGTPVFMRAQQLVDYQDKQFGGNDVMKRKTDFIIQKDPLAVRSASEVAALTTAGVFDIREAQLSGRLPNILDTIIREKGSEWFTKATYDQINVEVETIFAKVAPPLPEIRDDAES